MKKTLVALAAASAVAAFAQSSYSVDGIFDAGYMAINYKGNNVTAMSNTNGSSTSQINFRLSEDLGGGLKAVARHESDISVVSQKFNQGAAITGGQFGNGSSWGNGETRVGLESTAWGQIHLGNVNHETLTAFLVGQPFATAVGSTFRRIASADSINAVDASQVRSENAVKYITPAIEGVKLGVFKTNKQTVGGTTNFSSTYGKFDMAGVQELSLNYANGPLNVVFANHVTDFNGVGAASTATFATATGAWTYVAGADQAFKSTINTLGANYNFGKFTAYVMNQSKKQDDGTVNKSFTMYSVSYPMGAGLLMAGIGQGKDNGSAQTSTYMGVATKTTSLAYEYNLSKTTALYARYENISDGGNLVPAQKTFATAETTNGNRTTTALGLRVAF